MRTTTATSRELGSVPPFRASPAVHDASQATVTGTLPEWLRGELVRTCPAVFQQGNWRAGHWFDGLGMLYAFRIDGPMVSFRSRLLESQAAGEIIEGRARLSSFGTPTGRTLWQRIVQPVQRSTDNTNVNILQMGEDLVALTEGARQLRIDPQSLRSMGTLLYERDGLVGTIMGAHPHFDATRQRILNIATGFGTSGTVTVYEHGVNARRRELIGSWHTERVPYLHAFGLTPQHVILLAHPFSVRPMDMLWSNRGYIDHFAWRPQDGTRLLTMQRSTGAITEYETDPLFVFHVINAFEHQGDTILDALVYPNADVMGELRAERMVNRLPDLRPVPTRFVMHPGRRRATRETLADTGFEFPSIHYRRVNGQDYRFAWGAADGPQPDGRYASTIVKADVRSGKVSTFTDGDRLYGEPVFVAQPGGEEDEGVLLTVGASQHADQSSLLVIDARSMELLARADIAGAIPLGFHGSFIRSSTARRPS
jgi:beta,beta-carotene 9',10'-dioxygenase